MDVPAPEFAASAAGVDCAPASRGEGAARARRAVSRRSSPRPRRLDGRQWRRFGSLDSRWTAMDSKQPALDMLFGGERLQNPIPLFYGPAIYGARVGDLFMSLIHTCELNGVNPFDYLTVTSASSFARA